MTSPHPNLYSPCMDTNTQLNSDAVYEIRLRGHLASRWRAGFDGFHIGLADRGETVLTGRVADQAALFGVLKRVRDLGLPLLAVNRVEADGTPAQSQENNA